MSGKEKISDIVDVFGEGTVSLASSLMLDGILGNIIPGLSNIVSSYRQKRESKMLWNALKILENRQNEFGKLFHDKSSDKCKEIINEKLLIMLDNVVEETEEGKIDYLVNGFFNFASFDISNDVSYLFYDLLKELRLLDLRILKMHYNGFKDIKHIESFENLLDSTKLELSEFELIRKKLVTKGLIEGDKRKNKRERLDEELDNLIKRVDETLNKSLDDYRVELFEKLESSESKRELRSQKKVPENKIIASYQTSYLGRKFLDFFSE